MLLMHRWEPVELANVVAEHLNSQNAVSDGKSWHVSSGRVSIERAYANAIIVEEELKLPYILCKLADMKTITEQECNK